MERSAIRDLCASERDSRITLRFIRATRPCLPDGQNTQDAGQSAQVKIFHFTEFRKARMCHRNPAQRRGAYRDRHERGPGGGGRRWHRREGFCRAGNREQSRRAHDRCDRRTAKSCGPDARGLASSLVVMCGPTGPHVGHPQGDGAIVQRSRGEHAISRSNHCAGKAGMSPVALFSAMRSTRSLPLA